MRLAVGQKLGRYQIKEEIGAGGMGVVYRAWDEKLERDLAIKVLSPGALEDEAARKRFRHEARVLSRLNHPNIQTIFDFESVDGIDFIASELIPGQSLDQRIASGPVPQTEVVRIGVQLATGLAAAHTAGILHRDLKPANLRLTPDGHLKILDFGLAVLSPEALHRQSITLTSSDIPTGIAGTFPYMSPEQLTGSAIDGRSDIYSAGVTLFELAARRLPFRDPVPARLTDAILHAAPPPLRSLVPSISPELDRIVLKCLEKDPSLRYQSAKDLAADLLRLERSGPQVSAPAATLPVRRPRRNLLFTALAALLIAFALAAVLMFRYPLKKDSPLASPRWEQLTRYSDSAQIPAISRDGKLLAFLRGKGDFGSSASDGQLWLMHLPDGEPVQLTNTPFRKQTLSFAPDASSLYFTQIQGNFAWNTFVVPTLGAADPKQFMANATGLTLLDDNRVLFSTIKHGIHMVLASSNTSRTDERDLYVPTDTTHGMAHRSALSPDGKWIVLAEMDISWWRRCRLIPADGSSPGRQIGPEGTCTWAQWSPDGKFIYFTADTGSSGFHVWRQQFPDGTLEQLTPSGASEEEGLAVMPDGKSIIVSSGTQESSIWFHDDKAGDKQITSEGYDFSPALSPDGKKVYYLRRVSGAASYLNGELWVSDIETGAAERVFPGLPVNSYSISSDGAKVIFTTEQGAAGSNRDGSGIWIAYLDRTQPPRRLTSGGESRAFYAGPGEIIYLEVGKPAHLMRMNENAADQRRVSDLEVMQFQNVSPDGKWAIVGLTPEGTHGERNTLTAAIPLAGGAPVTICDSCASGFGLTRISGPFLSWSHDQKTAFVSARYFGMGSGTLVLPASPASPPPSFLGGFVSRNDLERIPRSRFINEDSVYPAQTGSRYVSARRSAKTNLFRIYLSE